MTPLSLLRTAYFLMLSLRTTYGPFGLAVSKGVLFNTTHTGFWPFKIFYLVKKIKTQFVSCTGTIILATVILHDSFQIYYRQNLCFCLIRQTILYYAVAGRGLGVLGGVTCFRESVFGSKHVFSNTQRF